MMKFLSNFSIKTKVIFLFIINFIALGSVGYVGMNALDHIGKEIVAIAEEDIPLTRNVTNVTAHQLEQAVYFERAIRYAEIMSGNPHYQEKYQESKGKFTKLAKKVDAEILIAEETVAEILTHAHTAEVTKEFQQVEKVLKRLEKAHKVFDEHVYEVFNMFDAGRLHDALVLAEKVEAEEAKINYEVEALLFDLVAFTEKAAKLAEEHEVEAYEMMQKLIIIGMLISLVMSTLIILAITRPMRAMQEATVRMAEGKKATIPALDAKDEVGAIARALNVVYEQSQKAVRMQAALDNSNANVMIADENHDTIYLNSSVVKLLKEAEADIKKDLPHFEAEKLLGQNIDVFHKDPSVQRNMLAKLTDVYNTSILVGGRSFDLSAVPVISPAGDRVGTSVEWKDGAAEGLVSAISKSQAVIEFQPDGTIIQANENFLGAMGYTLAEIQGKHHSMFADPTYAGSAEYRKFWEDLRAGEAKAGEFKRFAKGARKIWIQATYAPITDLKGNIVRVVKTASDITDMVQTRTENEAGMNEAVEVLNQMSAGNLTLTMDGDYQGAFKQIKAAVNSTIEKLLDTVAKIRDAADSVSGAAREISAGSQDLSYRTEQQASTLEETAASMEELTGTVRQNTENAQNASRLSTDASDIATEGGDVVKTAVEAMERIQESSQKISDIIGTIDDIAFQTNLLALNAAVEAARAGEAGKGFAVVASEVRSLAGRSAAASKEIKGLISNSVDQVKTGAELVNKSGGSLEEIVTSVQNVAELIQGIAAASAEQSTGIEEVNSAVTQMDEATQQNAALVEESTAAAQSMTEQAYALTQLVGFFKTNEEELTAGNDAPPPAAAEPAAAPKADKPAAKKPAAKKPAPKPAPEPVRKPAPTAEKVEADWEEF